MALAGQNRVEDVVVVEPEEKPYKWFAPRQLRLVDGHYIPAYSTDYVDPRLGQAQKDKEERYAAYRLGDPNADDPFDFEDDVQVPQTDFRIVTAEEIQAWRENKKPHPLSLVNFNEEAWKQHHKIVANLTVKNEAKNLKKRDSLCAELAIKFYNDKHGTQFEIVETFGSYSGLFCGFWFHCNFRAADPGSGTTVSPKLFFAELHKTTCVYDVKDCIIIDGPGLSTPIDTGCRICGNQLLHPANRVHGFDEDLK